MPAATATPAALTIAGSDSGGNAGIQADLLTFAAHQVHGATAITCLTAQNPTSVSSIQAANPEVVDAQISQVLAYYPIRAIKTGMLFNQEIIQAVANNLEKASATIPLIVDPVSVASSGQALLKPDAVEALKAQLLPLATLITPNLDEAQLLLGHEVQSIANMEAAAAEMAEAYHAAVLLKGGHLQGEKLTDILVTAKGEAHHFTQKRIQNIDTHGSGCTLSSAIAAQFALGKPLLEAVQAARHYLRRSMESPLKLNQSHFINHQP